MNRKVLVPMVLTLGIAAFVAGIFLFNNFHKPLMSVSNNATVACGVRNVCG